MIKVHFHDISNDYKKTITPGFLMDPMAPPTSWYMILRFGRKFGDIEIVTSEDCADVIVIFKNVRIPKRYNHRNLLYVQTEPKIFKPSPQLDDNKYIPFLTCNPNETKTILYETGHIFPHFVELNINNLELPTKKTKLGSIFLGGSNKPLTGAYKFRHRFIECIARNNLNIDIFGDGGKKWHPDLKQTKNSPVNKCDGLDQYMFNIMVENNSNPKLMTEKGIDPVLRNTVPLYFCQDYKESVFHNEYPNFPKGLFDNEKLFVKFFKDAEQNYSKYSSFITESIEKYKKDTNILSRIERAIKRL